jgi:hypothetical protein
MTPEVQKPALRWVASVKNYPVFSEQNEDSPRFNGVVLAAS